MLAMRSTSVLEAYIGQGATGIAGHWPEIEAALQEAPAGVGDVLMQDAPPGFGSWRCFNARRDPRIPTPGFDPGISPRRDPWLPCFASVSTRCFLLLLGFDE